MESIDQQEFPIICSLCCGYVLLNTRPREWLGCSCLNEILCCGHELCCKPGSEPITCEKKHDQLCHLGCYLTGCYFKIPTLCARISTQTCCIIQQTVFPCDENMPCIAGVCCLTLYPKVGCCVRYGEVENTGVCRFLSPSFRIAAEN